MKKSDTRWLDPEYITRELAVEIDDILTRGRFPRKRAIKQALAPITSDWVDWLNGNMKVFVENFQASLIKQMEEGMGGGIPQTLQPPDCRMLAGRYEYCALVLEQAPQQRTIVATQQTRPFDRSGRLQVSFPYMIYMLTFNKGTYDHLHVAVRTKPLKSLSDKLHLSGLPNIGPRYDMTFSSEGHGIPVFINKRDWPFGVCMGEAAPRLVGMCRNKTLSEQAEIVLREFWATKFQANEDRFKPDYFSWEGWGNMTGRRQLEILDVHFPEAMSLQKALEYLLPRDMEVNPKGVHKELDRMYSQSFQDSWKKLKPDGELMEAASGDVSEMLENTLHYIARRVANKLQEVPDEKVRAEAVKAFMVALQEAVK